MLLQGLKPETQASGSASGAPVTEGVKPNEAPKVSEDKYKNYAIVAGTITGLAAVGWWYKTRSKKTEEVHDWVEIPECFSPYWRGWCLTTNMFDKSMWFCHKTMEFSLGIP